MASNGGEQEVVMQQQQGSSVVEAVEGNADNHDNYIDQSAHLLGNYHKYYTFHSAECRIDLLQQKSLFLDLWKSLGSPAVFNLMDIGCNEGDLSIALWQLIRSELPPEVQCRVVGVDLDQALIDLGKSKAVLHNGDCSPHSAKVIFDCVDFTKPDQIDALRLNLQANHGIEELHLITVFSTTMWIHINVGDDGLRHFFSSAKSFLAPKGVLLVEPQPGRCYTHAAKRCRKLGLESPPFLHVVDRTKADELITKILRDEQGLPCLDFIGKEVWGRSIYLFHDNTEFESSISDKTLPKVDVSVPMPKSKKKKLNHPSATDNGNNNTVTI